MKDYLQLAALLLPVSLAFNPMELYVGKEEGVAFYSYKNRGYFACYTLVGGSYQECDSREAYKTATTKILASDGTEDGWYTLVFQFSKLGSGGPAYSVAKRIQVIDNGDHTVAFRCEENGLFMRHQSVLQDYSGATYPFCTEPGICEECRFLLEVGSVVPITIEILDIRWGTRDGEVMANPSVVAKDQTDNWSEETITTDMTVRYSGTQSDTTVWQKAWGFEFSVSISVECNIPFVGSMTSTASTTISYDGSEGEEHTVTKEQTFEDTKTFPCPPHSRCEFKLVSRMLDNVDMPFTATVKRNLEDGTPFIWEEEGVWYGVTALEFQSFFCTTDLITQETNCPIKYKYIY